MYSLRYSLRTIYCLSSRESRSTVHPPGSHSRCCSLWKSLSTGQSPGNRSRQSNHRGAGLDGLDGPANRGAALDGPTFVKKLAAHTQINKPNGLFIQKNNINALNNSYNICLLNTKILLCVQVRTYVQSQRSCKNVPSVNTIARLLHKHTIP